MTSAPDRALHQGTGKGVRVGQLGGLFHTYILNEDGRRFWQEPEASWLDMRQPPASL